VAEAALYTGGEIVTLDERWPHPEALATLGPRILALGDASGCR
jgi:predicted amidohydrolase YtcJ